MNYGISGDTGELIVKQESGEGATFGGEARNEWDLRFNDDVSLDLNVQLGVGESALDSLTLTALDLSMGGGRDPGRPYRRLRAGSRRQYRR